MTALKSCRGTCKIVSCLAHYFSCTQDCDYELISVGVMGPGCTFGLALLNMSAEELKM